ncbi:LAGLIDADG family homing endonuclease [Aneurinibacillus thermoaerophilus]|uniref:LAGLIDADG family homing endonuclease n=1 Tax=Aneurinibacillus thermoaerophilus TaxID=143495 RepID=UPI000B82380C|nr:LAGLIDADG family homing endonuclease [Aneurinibacillus thermoaerophilus]
MYQILGKSSLILTFYIFHSGALKSRAPNVPEEFFSHFARGVFDGDAYFKTGADVVVMRPGSRVLSKRLMDKLEELGAVAELDTKEDVYRITITGIDSLRVFYDWLYKDARGVYISTKREQFTKRFDYDFWKKQQPKKYGF